MIPSMILLNQMIKKYFKKVNKSRGFTRLVDLGDAILSRTKSASPKLTTGFTLVETLIAVSIFSFSILALMAVLFQGISDTGYAKKKMIAGYLAQEGIEYIRNKRDYYVLYPANRSWVNFRDGDISDITPLIPSDPAFTRTIQKNVINENEVKIFSTVSWTQGSGTYSITFTENLFNWVE